MSGNWPGVIWITSQKTGYCTVGSVRYKIRASSDFHALDFHFFPIHQTVTSLIKRNQRDSNMGSIPELSSAFYLTVVFREFFSIMYVLYI